jgi:hypothetical protein
VTPIAARSANAPLASSHTARRGGTSGSSRLVVVGLGDAEGDGDALAGVLTGAPGTRTRHSG